MTFVVDIIFWVFGKLPVGVSIKLGGAFGWGLQHVLKFRYNDIQTHRKYAFPDWSEDQIREWTDGVYRHFGLLLSEFLRMPGMTSADFEETCTVSGLHHLDSALAKERGVLVLTGHLGNWELCLAAMARLGYRSHAVVKQIKTRAGAHFANRLRLTHGVRPIDRRNALKPILKALENNGSVGFVLDQNMTAKEGIFVDFFGRPACTMPGLAVLSHRYDVPVIPMSFHRCENPRKHCIEIYPEVEWEEVAPKARENVQHNTQRYTRILEEMIYKHPRQWLWMHRRWRTQPDPANTSSP